MRMTIENSKLLRYTPVTKVMSFNTESTDFGVFSGLTPAAQKQQNMPSRILEDSVEQIPKTLGK